MQFNESLKCLLEKYNLKQSDLCKVTGITASLMHYYLTGERIPTITNAIKIADALNITLDELAGRTR